MQQRLPPDAPPAKSKSFLPSRRAFLIGAGASVGLVVGFALWPRSYPNARAVAEGETLLNAWVKIGPDGAITVAIPQAEMGQGVWSGMAQILADEMGADWSMVAVEPAPFHPAFAITGLAKGGTADLPPMIRDVAAFVGTTVIERLNLHITGGSTSVRSFHDALREAGATARTLLVEAAAKAWKVSASELEAEKGEIRYKANRMGFGEAAALVEPDATPNTVKLRDRPAADAGRAAPRIDIPPKVDGSARFGADVRLPGMVFAAIRHGPVNGQLVSAEAPADVALVKGPNFVAATGATSFEAQRAVAAIKAEFRTEGKPAGAWIEQELNAALAAPGEAVAETGDIEAAFSGKTITADYSLPFLAHACMEPMTATARIVGDRVEIWGPTQSITLAVGGVARALDVDAAQITIHPTLLGGGFGRKVDPDAMVEAALIARATGKPVQLLFSREEDFQADKLRPPVAARMRGSLAPDGGIAGFDARIAVPSVGFSFFGRNLPMLAGKTDKPNATAIEGAERIPYRVGAFRAAHLPIAQPVPIGYWRSVGHSFTGFLIESFVDELAAEAGADPLAFRLKLLQDAPRHAAVLRAAANLAGWTAPLPAGFGRGLAIHESFGSVVAMVVEAGIVDGAIRISRLSSAIDCGRAINPDSVRAQVEGGALFGLSAAVGEAVTFFNGEAEQRNFDAYPVLKLADAPTFETVIVQSDAPLGGVGEPGTPPAAPALANALYAATGKRARSLPLSTAYA
jgi:isoquinoline 1-oxidoreductase beta subunit